MTKDATNDNGAIVVRVSLDDISERYARNITAEALSKSLVGAYYNKAFCEKDANKKFQRTAKRRR